MVYEMLTGVAPFVGPTVQAIMAKLFTEHAPPLRDSREEVPAWVGDAVHRCLAKRSDDRFPTAGEFAQALGWPSGSTPPGTPAGSGGPKSIAVLPFVNMSADPENEYFTDGIAEEIINALIKVQALRVASRTSSFAFKGKNVNIRKVGEELNVGTVLEGSVRKAGNRLRVMAQLVNVSDGYHLWSERYDRQMDDVFAIQDEISENIVKALKVVLSEDEKRAIEKPPTENVEAYEYYLRARQYFHQFRRTGMQFARRMFERAIDVDPKYSKAYAGVADCCSFMYMYWDGSKANLEGADTASKRALELDPELAEANASRGFALSLSRQYEEARKYFETAIRLNPKLYEAHYLYARACFQEGRLEDAVRQYEEASRVRPEDYQALLLIQSALHGLGRHEDAKDALRRGLVVAEKHLELNPDDARALCLGGQALMQLDEPERALEWAQRAHKIDPTDSGILYNVACVYALGEMTHQALDCLDQAIQNGFGHREWLDHDTDLDSLREDPRFEALRQKL
jgi:TolB-like protein/Flp pilus assembly protein TadD